MIIDNGCDASQERHDSRHVEVQVPRPGEPIGHDALSDLTDQHEEEDEGQDPAQVVAREVQPCAVMNVNLGALTAPPYEEDGEGDEEQEYMGHHVQGVHEAAVVQDAVVDVVGAGAVVAAAEGQGHGERSAGVRDVCGWLGRGIHRGSGILSLLHRGCQRRQWGALEGSMRRLRAGEIRILGAPLILGGIWDLALGSLL